MEPSVAIGGGIYLPIGPLQDGQKLATEQAANLSALKAGTGGTVPDTAAQRQIIKTAASLAVFPPAPVVQGAVRLGLLKGLDAGFSWSSSTWRLDGKLRLRGKKSGSIKLALLGGIEVYTFDLRLFQLDKYLQQDISPLFEYVKLDKAQRYDASLSLLISARLAKILVPYAAVEYRMSIYHLPLVLSFPVPPQTFVHEETLNGSSHYGGAVVGIGIGPKFIRLFLELHAGYAIAPGKVMGESAQFGGPALFPAAGLSISL